MNEREVAVKSSGGIGFFGLLGILFIGLKLTGHIDWPWWVVTMPLWFGVALALVFIAVVAVVLVAAGITAVVAIFCSWIGGKS